MASTLRHHLELTGGVGKCSVPMWQCGCPAGFCDKPAFGKQTRAYLDNYKYANPMYHQPAYAPGLACHGHGGPAGGKT